MHVVKTSNRILWIAHAIIIVFVCWTAYRLAWSGFFIDWDMRSFIRAAQAGECDALQNTPVHNVIIMLIWGAIHLLKPITPHVEALIAAKLLSAFFSSASVLVLFIIVLHCTRNTVLATIAALLWYILPGNFFLLRSLDDNVWANLFNILFLYQVLVLTRCVSGRFVFIQPGVLYIIWIGACLSLGVNVHQQLVPLLYAFPIIVIFFLRGTYRQKIIRLFAFIAGYGGCSAIQDYFVFSAVSWTAIFSRCYHTPYHALFPHCWFFSSGSTIGAWIHKIGDGIRKSFYIDGGLMPCFLVVALISLTGAFLTIYRWYTRRTLRNAEEVTTFALLACLTIIHLPHSLLYEPWSVERWDATYPGIIVLGATGYYAAMKEEAVSVLHVIRKMRFHILFCGIVCVRLVNLLLWL